MSSLTASSNKVRLPALIFYSTLCLLLALLTACLKERESSIFEEGERLIAKGDFKQALERFKYLADKYPSSIYAPQSRYKIGMINYLYYDDPDKALDAYLSLILMYPESREVFPAKRDMARIYSKRGEHRQAVEVYQWLVENSSGIEKNRFRYRIAMEYQKMSDFRQAIVEIEEILEGSPSTPLAPDLYYQMAINHYLNNNPVKSISIFDKLVSLYPDNPITMDARLGKAMALEELGRLKEAKEVLKAIEDVYPNRDAIKIRISGIEKRIKDSR